MADQETIAPLAATAMLVLVIAAVAVPLTLLARWRGRRRDAHLAQRWDRAIGATHRPGVEIAYIGRVYQYARRGCKADIEWLAGGRLQDTWFKGWHAPAGVWVVLSGGVGWGPHNSNPKVLYVLPGGVLMVLPAQAQASRRRPRSRLAKRARARSDTGASGEVWLQPMHRRRRRWM